MRFSFLRKTQKSVYSCGTFSSFLNMGCVCLLLSCGLMVVSIPSLGADIQVAGHAKNTEALEKLLLKVLGPGAQLPLSVDAENRVQQIGLLLAKLEQDSVEFEDSPELLALIDMLKKETVLSRTLAPKGGAFPQDGFVQDAWRDQVRKAASLNGLSFSDEEVQALATIAQKRNMDPSIWMSNPQSGVVAINDHIKTLEILPNEPGVNIAAVESAVKKIESTASEKNELLRFPDISELRGVESSPYISEEKINKSLEKQYASVSKEQPLNPSSDNFRNEKDGLVKTSDSNNGNMVADLSAVGLPVEPEPSFVRPSVQQPSGVSRSPASAVQQNNAGSSTRSGASPSERGSQHISSSSAELPKVSKPATNTEISTDKESPKASTAKKDSPKSQEEPKTEKTFAQNRYEEELTKELNSRGMGERTFEEWKNLGLAPSFEESVSGKTTAHQENEVDSIVARASKIAKELDSMANGTFSQSLGSGSEANESTTAGVKPQERALRNLAYVPTATQDSLFMLSPDCASGQITDPETKKICACYEDLASTLDNKSVDAAEWQMLDPDVVIEFLLSQDPQQVSFLRSFNQKINSLCPLGKVDVRLPKFCKVYSETIQQTFKEKSHLHRLNLIDSAPAMAEVIYDLSEDLRKIKFRVKKGGECTKSPENQLMFLSSLVDSNEPLRKAILAKNRDSKDEKTLDEASLLGQSARNHLRSN